MSDATATAATERWRNAWERGLSLNLMIGIGFLF
jgi:hypothetical protein